MPKTLRLAAAAVCALVSWALPVQVRAAGLNTPDMGARSLGQGGADTADPKSLTALYYNPGAVANLQGFNALLDLRGFVNQVHFQRFGSAATNLPYQRVANTGGPLIAPALALSYSFKAGIPWGVAFGFSPPSAYSGDRYPDYFKIRAGMGSSHNNDSRAAAKSPQRYQVIEQGTQGFLLDLTLSAKPHPMVAVGAQLQMPVYHFKTKQSLFLSESPGDNGGYDAILDVDAKNGLQFSGSFGVTAQLPAGFHVGATFQLPTAVRASGTMNITVPEFSTLNDIDMASGKHIVTLTGNKADLAIDLPWMARLGVRYDQPLFSVELDGVYEAWSMYKYITLSPHDIFVTQTVDGVANTKPLPPPSGQPIKIATGMTDAGSVRLGGELRVGELAKSVSWLKVRAGLIYETSAVPLAYTSVRETNWDRFIPTIGIGGSFGPIDVDLAYAHVFQPDRTVNEADVKKADGNYTVPVSPTTTGSPATNKGTYQVIIDLIALSVGGHFG